MLKGKILLHNYWGFLQVDHELGRYYRNLFLLEYCLKLQRPSNGEHITIISPWDNIHLVDYHYLNGNILEFELDNKLYWNGNALWLDVISSDIDILRGSLVLDDMLFPPHFCIGYFDANEMDESK